MKQFLKEKLALAAGIYLPLLGVLSPLMLALVFFVATQVTVDPPQHKVVFSTQAHNYNIYNFDVNKDGKLTISYQEIDNRNYARHIGREATIYIFDPVTNQMEQFKIDPPNVKKSETPYFPPSIPANVGADTAKKLIEMDRKLAEMEEEIHDPVALEIPVDLAKLNLNNSTKSSDGYIFQARPRNDNLFNKMFGHTNHQGYELYKGGRHIPIPDTNKKDYRNYKTFIGWVTL